MWLRTEGKCTEEDILQAFGNLIGQLSLLFATITETLTVSQLNLLKALIAGEKALSSAQVILKYRLVSSANVNRSRNALFEKEILDNNAGVISFQDPMYRQWLAIGFFK
ncbi:MAG: hypothetical protein WCE64_01235 [Bacteroidales bacterium]